MSDRAPLSESETNDLLNAALDGDFIAFLARHDALLRYAAGRYTPAEE